MPGSAWLKGTPAMDLGHVNVVLKCMYLYVGSTWDMECQFILSFFFWCFAATQIARQLHQEHTQVVCSNKEVWRRLARRHSRNGPWTHECCFEVNVFVCWDCIYNVECCLK